MNKFFAGILAIVAGIMSYAVSAQDNKQSVVVAQSTADGAGGQPTNSNVMKFPDRWEVKVFYPDHRRNGTWDIRTVGTKEGKQQFSIGYPYDTFAFCRVNGRSAHLQSIEEDGTLTIVSSPDQKHGSCGLEIVMRLKVRADAATGTVTMGGGLQEITGSTLKP